MQPSNQTTPMYVIIGHYCATDANPETDIPGALGLLDEWIGLSGVYGSREAAFQDLPWWPDGLVVPVVSSPRLDRVFLTDARAAA